MTRTNQGGSIVSFIVVAAVLALLLIGGAYLVHRQNNSDVTPTPTPTEDAQEPSIEGSDPDEKSAERASGNREQENNDRQAREEPADQPSSDNDSAPSSDEQADQSYPQAGVDVQPEQLPETGPAGSALSLLGAGSLTSALIWYWRSRKML